MGEAIALAFASRWPAEVDRSGGCGTSGRRAAQDAAFEPVPVFAPASQLEGRQARASGYTASNTFLCTTTCGFSELHFYDSQLTNLKYPSHEKGNE
jgi:hypothetical protein